MSSSARFNTDLDVRFWWDRHVLDQLQAARMNGADGILIPWAETSCALCHWTNVLILQFKLTVVHPHSPIAPEVQPPTLALPVIVS